MPATHTARTFRRGFSLLELLAVVSIMAVALLVFASVLGSRATGPALERAAATVSSLVTNVRQNAAIRKVHGEIVFDYKHDRVVALGRRRLASFAMEDETGSGDALGRRSGGADFAASRTLALRDGKCLDLPTGAAGFTIPWDANFDTSGDYEGIALAFDYCPAEVVDRQGLSMATSGALANMGAVFDLSVVQARNDSVRLALNSGGINASGSTWLANYVWHRVEVAVSRYGVCLWIDGRLNEGLVTADDFAVAPAHGQDLCLGGVPCMIDNVEMFSLVSSQTYELDGCQLIVPETDPQKEITGEAENIYLDKTIPKPSGPVTGPGAEAGPMLGAGLPRELVPAIRHIYFDTAGKLDAARHGGAEEVHLVSQVGGELRRMVLTFQPQGVMTSEYVEYFPWETPPAANAPGGPG